ncbi:MAG: hypothetical protein AAGE99_04580 [Chlamydiota bacterium]
MNKANFKKKIDRKPDPFPLSETVSPSFKASTATPKKTIPAGATERFYKSLTESNGAKSF